MPFNTDTVNIYTLPDSQCPDNVDTETAVRGP